MISSIAFFVVSNAVSCSVSTPNWTLTQQWAKGAHSWANFWINRFIWLIAPLNDRKSFIFLGFNLSVIACSFPAMGVTLLAVNLNPSHSVSDWAILHLSSFNLIPASSNTFITSSTLSKCCCFLPFVTLEMSSMNVKVIWVLCGILSMIF